MRKSVYTISGRTESRNGTNSGLAHLGGLAGDSGQSSPVW